MKKILTSLLVLALCAPAMAATVGFVDNTDGTGTFTITATEYMVGLGLDVDSTADVTAVAITPAAFNIYPDAAYSQELGDGYAYGEGGPACAKLVPGEIALPQTSFALCFANLNGATTPGASGAQVVTVTFTVPTGGTVTIAENATRGGVIGTLGEDIALDGTLVGTITNAPAETVSKPTINKTTAAPAVADKVNGGRVETFVASATSNLGHALEYQFTWGDSVVGPWGPATQTYTYTYAAAGTYTVTVQARCAAHPTVVSDVSDNYVVSREAVKSTAAGVGRPAGEAYAAWALFDRPNCWAFKRNCRGDANGLKSGLSNFIWVNSDDLAIFSAAYNKNQTDLLGVVVSGVKGICSDNNRLRSGLSNFIWVNSGDLTEFSTYYNKQESYPVPTCDLTQWGLHYYTN